MRGVTYRAVDVHFGRFAKTTGRRIFSGVARRRGAVTFALDTPAFLEVTLAESHLLPRNVSDALFDRFFKSDILSMGLGTNLRLMWPLSQQQAAAVAMGTRGARA